MVFKRPKKTCIYKDRDCLYSPNGGVPALWKTYDPKNSKVAQYPY